MKEWNVSPSRSKKIGQKMVLFLQDFRDMIECLDAKGVSYIVVGAFAMAHFGYVRATGDIDIFVEPTELNSRKMIEALKLFGAPLHGISADFFATPGHFLQVGVPPCRIDVLTCIDGVSFHEAFATRSIGAMGDRKIPFLSLDLLILNKESTGREKDAPDAAELRKIKAQMT
jgi:hypothetical protein